MSNLELPARDEVGPAVFVDRTIRLGVPEMSMRKKLAVAICLALMAVGAPALTGAGDARAGCPVTNPNCGY